MSAEVCTCMCHSVMFCDVVYVVGEMGIASYFGVGVEEPALLGPNGLCMFLTPPFNYVCILNLN